MQKSLSAMGVGLLGMGSIVVPSSAAATTPECGTSTSTMVISFTSGICQAEFSLGTVGDPNTFTVPNVSRGLAAILVGAGGGSYIDGTLGYGGSGGEVNYLDLSSVPAGEVLSVVVGHGASAIIGDVGGDTSVTVDSAQTLVEGGAGGTQDFFCALDGSGNTYLGEGRGAGGDPVRGASPGFACLGAGPGITPSEGDLDNAGNAVPEVFRNFSVELGKGGSMANVLDFPDPLLKGPGQGAGVRWDLTVPEYVIPNQRASDGLVVFRWYPTAEVSPAAPVTNSLAATGQNSIQAMTTSAVTFIMVFLGLALLSISNGMRRQRK